MGKKKKKQKNSYPAKSRPLQNIHGEKFLAGLVILFLISIEFAGIFQFWKDHRIKKSWKTTEGILSKCEEIQEVQGYPIGVELEYSYQVENKKYLSSTLALQDLWIVTLDELKRYIPDACPGQKVTLYYNPENPKESILIFRYSWGLILSSILIPPLLLITALLILDPGIFLFWRRRKTQIAVSVSR